MKTKFSLFLAIVAILSSCNKGEIARLEKEKATITATKDSLLNELSSTNESLSSANERIENDSVIAKTGLSLLDFSGTDIEPHFNSEDLGPVKNPDGLAEICLWIPYLFGKESNFLRNELEKPEILSSLFQKNKKVIPIILWATGTEEKAISFAKRLLPYCAGIAKPEYVLIFDSLYLKFGTLEYFPSNDSLWVSSQKALGLDEYNFDQEYKSYLFAKRRMDAGGLPLINAISEILIYIINGEQSEVATLPESVQEQRIVVPKTPMDVSRQKLKVVKRE